MKNIIKSLFIIAMVSLSVIACDEDKTTFDTLIFPANAFVSINGSDISVLESTTDPIEIVVNYSNSSAGFTSAVSVDFDITSSNATEGVHYTIEDDKTQFNFPVGTYSDKVVIIPINNFTEDGDKVLNFEITNSNAAVGLPGPDSNGTSLTVTLVDDDCAFTFADLDGISWIGTDSAGGSQGPNATQIETFFDGTNLLMEGLSYGWITGSYWDEVVINSNQVVVDMDPVTGVFTIDEQFLCTTTWNGNVQPDYGISATGQYFSCLHKMVVDYILYQGGDELRTYTETVEF